MNNVFLSVVALITYICSCIYIGKKENDTAQRRLAYTNSINNFIILIFLSIFIPNIPISDSHFIPFISWILLSEFLFTISHRILHTKYLYFLHKQHHQNNPSYTTSSFDASLFEFLVGNIGTGVLPMYFIYGSKIAKVSYTIIVIYNVVLSHSREGPHIIHHKLFNYNYGQGLYLFDRLFGTYK
tara:strand:- start:35 stop:586 length:552 start_codon:yes stop_codon:yes gene_type:complete